MNHTVAIMVAAVVGLVMSLSPQSIARFNTRSMERLPAEERSEYMLQWWRSRTALIIVRGIGIGMVLWAALAYATVRVNEPPPPVPVNRRD